jgi:hypothetical protein
VDGVEPCLWLRSPNYGVPVGMKIFPRFAGQVIVRGPCFFHEPISIAQRKLMKPDPPSFAGLRNRAEVHSLER